MKQLFILLTLLFSHTIIARADINKQAAANEKYNPVPRIIVDTDIDSDVDDVAALAMLYNLHLKKQIELIGIIVTSDDPYAPTCVSALNRFYGLRSLPVGFLEGQTMLKNHSRYTRQISESYPKDLLSYKDAKPATDIYRTLLASSPDNSVTIITIGHLSSLQKLLESKADRISRYTGKKLVDKKVNKWYCMGGKFPEGKEANFYRPDPASTVYCLKTWKKEVVFCGWEIGVKVKTGDNRIKNNLSENHPLSKSYELYNNFSGRASWDQIAVFLLTNQYAEYFYINKKGKCIVNADGSNYWKKGGKSNHSYLIGKETADFNKLSEQITNLMLGK